MFPPMNVVATYTKLKPSSRPFFCMKSLIQGFLEATFGFKGPVQWPCGFDIGSEEQPSASTEG